MPNACDTGMNSSPSQVHIPNLIHLYVVGVFSNLCQDMFINAFSIVGPTGRNCKVISFPTALLSFGHDVLVLCLFG